MNNQERFIQATNRIRELNERLVGGNSVSEHERTAAKLEYIAALNASRRSGEEPDNYWRGLD